MCYYSLLPLLKLKEDEEEKRLRHYKVTAVKCEYHTGM